MCQMMITIYIYRYNKIALINVLKYSIAGFYERFKHRSKQTYIRDGFFLVIIILPNNWSTLSVGAYVRWL